MLAALLILGALVAGTVITVTAARRGQDVLQAVNEYQVAVTTERGTTNTRDPFTDPELRAIQGNSATALKHLASTALPASALAELLHLDRAYQTAVTAEFDALAAGNAALASHIDLVAADPSFTPLAAALQRVFDDASRGAKLSATIVNVVSIILVVVTALLALLFIVIDGRRRNRSAVADAQSARLAEAALLTAERERSFRTIFDRNPQPMWVSERGRGQFLAVNQATLLLYGYTRDEFLTLAPTDLVVPEEHEQLHKDVQKMMDEPNDYSFESHNRTKNGAILDVTIDTRAAEYEGRQVTLVCARNMTDRVALQNELEQRAFHDALTGLPNRALFGDRLEHAHSRMERSATGYVVLMIDIDDFKAVNDSLGHTAGDELLIAVAARLRAVVRVGDTAARLGGDEFAILVEDIDDVSSALRMADHILEALRSGLTVAGRTVTAAATIGIACSAQDTLAWEVVRNADTALYVGKSRGKGRYELFSAHMHTDAHDRLTMEQELHDAVIRGELVLHYQPKVETFSGRVVGIEALTRWNHPVRGLIPPEDFIPLAEESGLITEIDDWALLTACQQARQWWRQENHAVPVAVNVSGRDMESGDFGKRLRKVLQVTGLHPSLLELEITEGSALRQEAKALALLEDIRTLGVRIAMDDFGTGYSMLSRLQGFPMDTLKIDRSFVQRISSATIGAPIVAATIVMGHDLGLTVVAEGVETEVQREYLADHGCDQLQGYLISRPVVAGLVLPLLRRNLLPQIPDPRLTPPAALQMAS
jgi:diguanylate cyclase (GGDEF)-like protein/PAS domain S-box-containing protein